MAKWFKIQEPGDRVPFAVAYIGSDKLARRYVPGVGLVDWPSLNSYGRIGAGSDLGAIEISAADAKGLIRAGVGKFPEDFDYSSEVGEAPVLQVPG